MKRVENIKTVLHEARSPAGVSQGRSHLQNVIARKYSCSIIPMHSDIK